LLRLERHVWVALPSAMPTHLWTRTGLSRSHSGAADRGLWARAAGNQPCCSERLRGVIGCGYAGRCTAEHIEDLTRALLVGRSPAVSWAFLGVALFPI